MWGERTVAMAVSHSAQWLHFARKVSHTIVFHDENIGAVATFSRCHFQPLPLFMCYMSVCWYLYIAVYVCSIFVTYASVPAGGTHDIWLCSNVLRHVVAKIQIFHISSRYTF